MKKLLEVLGSLGLQFGGVLRTSGCVVWFSNFGVRDKKSLEVGLAAWGVKA